MAYKLIQYYCCDRTGKRVFLPFGRTFEARRINMVQAHCILGCSGCALTCEPVVRIAVIKPDPVLEGK